MTDDAIDIYQAHLDVSTRLVFDGQAKAFCDHTQLPFVFRTARSVDIIETMAEMESDICHIHEWLTEMGVTDYHRIARSAEYLDSNTIEGFHVSYALRGALPVVEPYTSRMILRRGDDRWRVSFSEHELADPLFPGRDTRARHGIFAAHWSRKPKPVLRDHEKALAAYQAVIDRIADVSIRDDFDGLTCLYTLPYDVHLDEGSYTVETHEGMRRFHEKLQSMVREHAADRLTLQATYAVFLNDDRLLGYHEARLMRGQTCCFGPVRSRLLLTDEAGPWQVKSISNAISTTGWNKGEMIISPVLPTVRDISKRTKT